ncbi:MAG: sigma-54 dependent transcriptional regulator [Thermoanaerobaculales bacterium]|jgi:DNA-binding NtrC family response regulator|nr:sigma-54 dependent transcriptional regulator [Thermoanaerobaculales bacterium]
MSNERLLIVDDDPGFARTLQILLEDEGYRTEAAHSGEAALQLLEHRPGVGMVISDLAMPGMDGLELLRRLRSDRPELPVVMMTAHSSVESAVEAIQIGAFQYLVKPIEPAELLAQVSRALEVRDLKRDHELLRQRTGDPAAFDVLVGSSPAMDHLRTAISRLAAVDSTVLVRGETGTGKELVARLIHDTGARAGRPFVVVNCTAIPGELLESELFGHVKGAFTGATSARTGRIEQADGGTLLLDEIGDMPSGLQPKLLRFLQDKRVQRVGGQVEREVDVRVIAATHRDLETAIADGGFREDLFHRLNTVPVAIPPLRDRLEDLSGLARHLAAKIARRIGRAVPTIEVGSLAALASHPFTGNVRELENLIERAMVLGDPSDDHLRLAPAPPITGGPELRIDLENGFARLAEVHEEAERDLVRRAVAVWADCSNDEIARRLGTQRRVLERRMRDYGIVKKQ